MTIKVLGRSRIDYLYEDDKIILNLNKCVPRVMFNPVNLVQIVNEFAMTHKKIELCGLADLCYRLEIDYSSDYCLDVVTNVKRFFKRYYPRMYFVQEGYEFDGSVGLLPIASLYKVNRQADVIYVHKILIDQLKRIGFSPRQIGDVLNTNENVKDLIPEDILDELPLMSDKNRNSFHTICEILGC